jgi:hypothetical protein
MDGDGVKGDVLSWDGCIGPPSRVGWERLEEGVTSKAVVVGDLQDLGVDLAALEPRYTEDRVHEGS